MKHAFLAALLILSGVSIARAADMAPGEAYLLIKNARPNVKEPDGWATDLLDVMREQQIPATRENVCAAIAVIDQESNFVANPAVPGLGKMAEKSIADKFGNIPLAGRYALHYLDTHPQNGPSYLRRIALAKTERDLDLTYRAFIEDSGRASNTSLLVQSGLLNGMIESHDNIGTAGSMQVSVQFALNEARKKRYLPMTLSDDWVIRDELYTRRGGMYYGVKQLLGYDTGYDRKIYRFADYNAGRWASRNAAFQHIVSLLTKRKLARDGDLLLYDKGGKPLSKISETEAALRAIEKEAGLNDAQIRTDLLGEKTENLPTSQTYIAVKNLFMRRFGKSSPYAELPGIDLASPKISHKMTTASYAASVNRRYDKCMAVK